MATFEVGDKVTWTEEGGTVSHGTVSLVLSAQYLIHTTLGTDRFVMMKDRTLKPYKHDEDNETAMAI